MSEPNRGRRNWKRNRDAQEATYANGWRIRGDKEEKLLPQRGERLEQGFAHMMETERLRRVHVRGREEIRKQILIQGRHMQPRTSDGQHLRDRHLGGLQGLAEAPAAIAQHLGAAIGHLLDLVHRRLGPLSAI